MEINNLSSGEFNRFGSVLDEHPAPGQYHEEHKALESGQRMEKVEASVPVIIDYDTGMTLLVIFEDGNDHIFYLDRVVMLRPGVVFSLVPLEQSSRATLIYKAGTILKTVGMFSVDDIKVQHPRLGFGNILTFFCQKADGGFYFRGESHAPYEFVYVDRGALHTIVNGHDYILKKQESFIVGQNEWHIQYSDSSVRFITVSFFADERNMEMICGKKLQMSEKLRLDVEKMLQEKTERLFSTEYIEALFKIILIELIRNPETGYDPLKYPATFSSEKLLVDSALKYISGKIGEKIVLKDIADQLHISVPYLYKLFSSHLHMPPGKYIMKIKIEESKMLLREGKMTIGEIAQKMGFSSIQHFSKQFRNNCNMSPSQFIKTMK